MPAQVAIPLRFDTADPAKLRSDLERFAQALDVWTRGASELFNPRLIAVPLVNPSKLSFGMVARVNLTEDDVLHVQMPAPDRPNFGKRCAILRETTTGIVQLHPSGRIGDRTSTIAGASRYQMANDIHFVEFLLDDGDWYPTRPGSGIAL